MNPENLPKLLERAADAVQVSPAPDPQALRHRAGHKRTIRHALSAASAAAVVAAVILGTNLVSGPERKSDTTPNRPLAADLGPTRLFGFGHIVIRVPTSWISGSGAMMCGKRYWYFLERESPNGDALAPCTPITSALTSIPSRTQDTIAFGQGDPAEWMSGPGMLPDPALAQAAVQVEQIDGVEVQSRKTCGEPLFREPRAVFCRSIVYVPSEDRWIGAGSMRPSNRAEAAPVVDALLGSVRIDPEQVGIPPVPLFNLADPRNRVARYRAVVREYIADLRNLGLNVTSVENDHGHDRSYRARIDTDLPAGKVVPRGSDIQVTLTFSPIGG